MKNRKSVHDLFVSFTLILLLHFSVGLIALSPVDNYFFPFFSDSGDALGVRQAFVGQSGEKKENPVVEREDGALNRFTAKMGSQVVPYINAARFSAQQTLFQPDSFLQLPLPVVQLPGNRPVYRHLLGKRVSGIHLLSPQFSDNTIPPRPVQNMEQAVDERQDSYLLRDIYKDVIKAPSGGKDLLMAESVFLRQLKDDMRDGKLDMPFHLFIISAEYYQLSRALLKDGMRPDFTLDDAFARFKARLQTIKSGLSGEINGLSVVMMLQRYSKDKYYPENGSGMLLDSLFHNLNDCEGGTKEILAYLDMLYPDLQIGSSRGMLRTTTGELIGHMQVFIGAGAESNKIIANQHGVVLETTSVGMDSIFPYVSGDIFPLEDFVFRYYPKLIEGTPLAGKLKSGNDTYDQPQNIVGTSNHALKMSYGASSTLLTSQRYDLANIRTQKIVNGFQQSSVPGCDPGIDPTSVNSVNLFSNFVTIDKRLRRKLVNHYLAGLDYWDNTLMPQWVEPGFIAQYEDLVATLLAPEESKGNFIALDGIHSIPYASVKSHGSMITYIRSSGKNSTNAYWGKGRQKCTNRSILDKKILSFLFNEGQGPGLFFLSAPDNGFSWKLFLDNVFNDCLAVPVNSEEGQLVDRLAAGAVQYHSSLRKQLYDRGQSLGAAESMIARFEQKTGALEAVFTGNQHPVLLTGIPSDDSSDTNTSVDETLMERGKTGLNSFFLSNVYDFSGAKKLHQLLLLYGQRDDLQLTLPRAFAMVSVVASLLDSPAKNKEEYARFLEKWTKDAVDKTVQFVSTVALARVQQKSPAELSALFVNYLEQQESFSAERFVTLLHYGLREDEGVQYYRNVLVKLLAQLPGIGTQESRLTFVKREKLFVELIELGRIVRYFKDSFARQLFYRELGLSLESDFSTPPYGMGKDRIEDFGLIFNKLYLLVLMSQYPEWKDNERFSEMQLLRSYIRFSALHPVGKLMASLVKGVYGREYLTSALEEIITEQYAEIDRYVGLKKTDRLVEIVGEANAITYIFLQVDDQLAGEIAGISAADFSSSKQSKGFRYLDTLHRHIAGLDFFLSANDFAKVFYLDDRVRESFALLAYLVNDVNSKKRVKFRKSKNLRSIKDPSKVKVIEASRKVTRQDMSLLTFALNPLNRPRAIRYSWENTLAVVEKHLAFTQLTDRQKKYFYAPHAPYLTENDFGFFYSPEVIGDIHNADKWGGKNDILLSSYLHFRNMPDELPDWLLRTAMVRSAFEQKIIKKFEAQSFLPMILECSDDYKQFPGGLFRAKWKIRKVFGEDIFPATLLLIRMGYMEITFEGELIMTSKQSEM